MLQGEISSLSCEPHAGSELVVSLFEVPFNAASVAAFIAREHEFRFLAVQPYDLSGKVPTERLAVSGNRLVASSRGYRAAVLPFCRLQDFRCPKRGWRWVATASRHHPGRFVLACMAQLDTHVCGADAVE
jgi:hypothetical protein